MLGRIGTLVGSWVKASYGSLPRALPDFYGSLPLALPERLSPRGRACYSLSRLVSWTLVRRCARAGTYWYGTTDGALYYYGGKLGFILRLSRWRCHSLQSCGTIGGDVVLYSRVRQCLLLQWYMARHGLG